MLVPKMVYGLRENDEPFHQLSASQVNANLNHVVPNSATWDFTSVFYRMALSICSPASNVFNVGITDVNRLFELRYLVIDTPTHYVYVLRPGIIKIMFAPISHSLHKCEILNLNTYTWQISWWHTWESWLIDLIACFIFFVVKGKPPTTQKTLNDLNSFFKEEVWLLTYISY